jgi:hypothetical protein
MQSPHTESASFKPETQAGNALTSGNHNIYLDNPGVSAESLTMRLGNVQPSAFIAGINTATVSGAPVEIDTAAYSGHRDHSVRAIVITRSDHRDRSSERSDARAIVSSLVLSSQAELLSGGYQGSAPLANVACSAS